MVRRAAVCAVLAIVFTFAAAAAPLTVRELVERPQIKAIASSESGAWVSSLWVLRDIESNKLRAQLRVQRAKVGAKARPLVDIAVDPGAAIDETGALRSFGAEALWSPVEDRLAFVRGDAKGMRLLLRTPGTGSEREIHRSAHPIRLDSWTADGAELVFSVGMPAEPSKDVGIVIRDDDDFVNPRWFDRRERKPQWQTYRYAIATARLRTSDDAIVPSDDKALHDAIMGRIARGARDKVYLGEVMTSPDGRLLAFFGGADRHIDDWERATRGYFVGVASAGDGPATLLVETPHYPVLLGWTADGRSILALLRDAVTTTIAAINVKNGTQRVIATIAGVTYPEALNAARTRLFLVQHAALAPERLVAIDLQTGATNVLAETGDRSGHTLPKIELRRIEGVLGAQWGLLVYPNDFVPGRRYPLVFTTYRAYASTPIDGAVGGEYPILPWAAHGIAVFCLDTGMSNISGSNGDIAFEERRAKLPLQAMEKVVRQLDTEGLIDPARVGTTGLSYGSEVVEYAIAHSTLFRVAASAAPGFADPINRWLLPLRRDAEFDARGRVEPGPESWPAWKRLSPSLNVDRIRAALLIQSGDREGLLSVMLWRAARKKGVPIEWHVYANEGHVKVYPRNLAAVLERNLDWMRFWLTDQEDPDPQKLEQYIRWRKLRGSPAN